MILTIEQLLATDITIGKPMPCNKVNLIIEHPIDDKISKCTAYFIYNDEAIKAKKAFEKLKEGFGLLNKTSVVPNLASTITFILKD